MPGMPVMTRSPPGDPLKRFFPETKTSETSKLSGVDNKTSTCTWCRASFGFGSLKKNFDY
jgi:hypothetical protein